jgi:hypothetical protein
LLYLYFTTLGCVLRYLNPNSFAIIAVIYHDNFIALI